MGVHPQNLHTGSLGRWPRMLLASASAQAEPPEDVPLLPFPHVLAALNAGEPLTTGQIIARMGLLATPMLQRRIARALTDYGFQPMTIRNPDGTGAVRVWQAAPVDPISARWREVHEASDRERAGPSLTDLIFAPSRSGRFLIAATIGSAVCIALGWRP
ncbi:hypothetical protein [Sphingomonas koreensis]|uniref:hypothetical protein n=1 Tax=Sphingomonas koreensis TaxID=93064 RepID=UPI000F7E3DC0|nr:hypothetical protein [Sphingomonas koreensis]RSU32207.1 hypothetical protein CA225_02565 [Sphingomonas koreensis]RSU35701.1 hypothetical protein BRX39_08735 [Sphingomonas koreensis]RSU49872.1 hypothetical protein CA221_12355 [Sphingomonas koreensis]RSU83467.1 hypothetical protein CA253_21210 [Sphingomonas koreensis]RSU90491.1 hypothetical protein DAH52_20215 [Sphingomonas koreensis]